MASPSGQFNCDVCGKSFDVKRYLVKHEKRMHSDTSKKKEPVVDLKCSMCGKAFPRISHLQRHQVTHLNIREFKCPFCKLQFVQKAHLIRHVSRFHATEDIKSLNDFISTKRIKKEKEKMTPNDQSFSMPSTSSDTSTFCGSLLEYFLCFRCGQLFDNRFDLTRHLKITHKPLVCHHCNLIFYGIESLKLHELKTRNLFYKCHCGSSFNKKDTFDRHQDACAGKGTFICMECGQVFVQRTQFDRHYNKEHFLNRQCHLCEWKAVSPVSMHKHMKDEHEKDCCGFCGKLDPERNHIFIYHWKRVKKSISLNKKVRVPVVSNKTLQKETKVESEEDEDETDAFSYDCEADVETSMFHSEIDGNHLEETTKEKIFLSENQYEFIMANNQNVSKNSTNDSLQVDLKEDEGLDQFADSELFEKASTNTLENEIILNLIVSVSDGAEEINLGEKLPSELLETFPDLRSAVILLNNSFPDKRFLNLSIPMLPPICDTDLTKWLSAPIQV
ncbi:unnamed protein product [Auanema sp. JU1783]|nr:unnamed protein product [Auanema sp. JU1783]